jgi:hypothetical protein
LSAVFIETRKLIQRVTQQLVPSSQHLLFSLLAMPLEWAEVLAVEILLVSLELIIQPDQAAAAAAAAGL